jgi:guanylate kinase
MTMERGLAIIISGPSGAGKSSVIKAVKPSWPGMDFSVSWTTRAPRPGEVDGVHYHFRTLEQFATAREAGEFLEYAEVHGNCYGTPKTPIFKAIDAGEIMVLDIDVQGARKIRQAVSGTPYASAFVYIFFTVPSLAELEARLRGRNTETEETLQRRLHNAAQENACWREYDYLVINDVLENAAGDLQAIIRANLCKTTHRTL